MFTGNINIKVAGSTDKAYARAYFFEKSQELRYSVKRPVVVLCPGGGYGFTSDREADPIAMQFMAKGYHTVILRYSVSPATFPTAILELGKVFLFLRKNASKYCIDTEKIVVQGCSAGGHLAASYSTFWNKDFVAKDLGINNEEKELLKPNGQILCYPVITSGEYAHHDSFKNLLGDRYEQDKEIMSLEKQVSDCVPPTFIWHTMTDDCVPVENSLLYVSALKKENISTEFHMYPQGHHGLSLGNDFTQSMEPQYNDIEECVQSWIGLALDWLDRL